MPLCDPDRCYAIPPIHYRAQLSYPIYVITIFQVEWIECDPKLLQIPNNSATVIIILSKLWANLPTDPEIQLCDPTPMLHSPRPHYRAKLGCTNHIITFSNGLVGVWQVISESFQFVFHLKTIIQKFTQFLHHALRDRPDPVYLPIWLG